MFSFKFQKSNNIFPALTSDYKIKVLGTVSEKTYCDSVGGKVKDEINIPVENKTMFLLKSDAE